MEKAYEEVNRNGSKKKGDGSNKRLSSKSKETGRISSSRKMNR